jgi:hypothetical protein
MLERRRELVERLLRGGAEVELVELAGAFTARVEEEDAGVEVDEGEEGGRGDV